MMLYTVYREETPNKGETRGGNLRSVEGLIKYESHCKYIHRLLLL